ncbi:MAG: hypothetical protein AAF915_19705 [Cyanobacteria bacterium P01_D01_bin.50]
MKKSTSEKLLQRYSAGERDFIGVDLSGNPQYKNIAIVPISSWCVTL